MLSLHGRFSCNHLPARSEASGFSTASLLTSFTSSVMLLVNYLCRRAFLQPFWTSLCSYRYKNRSYSHPQASRTVTAYMRPMHDRKRRAWMPHCPCTCTVTIPCPAPHPRALWRSRRSRREARNWRGHRTGNRVGRAARDPLAAFPTPRPGAPTL